MPCLFLYIDKILGNILWQKTKFKSFSFTHLDHRLFTWYRASHLNSVLGQNSSLPLSAKWATLTSYKKKCWGFSCEYWLCKISPEQPRDKTETLLLSAERESTTSVEPTGMSERRPKSEYWWVLKSGLKQLSQSKHLISIGKKNHEIKV